MLNREGKNPIPGCRRDVRIGRSAGVDCMMDTARNHFDQDAARARNLLAAAACTNHAPQVQTDILRASWMTAVGAIDAFFSDVYADLISRMIRIIEKEPGVNIPDRWKNLKMPVAAVLSPASSGWRWRMAARQLIEDENVLSLKKVKGLFNQFCRDDQKIMQKGSIGGWIQDPSARQRMFGTTRNPYRALDAAGKRAANEEAIKRLNGRFEVIFQRRHDCIHNCDRPRTALQTITPDHVRKTIEDVEFLADRCQNHLDAEFRSLLQALGFSAIARNEVGASPADT
jgi:hypothetical protein